MTSEDEWPPRPSGSDPDADDDLDGWMAAHFPPPQTSDDNAEAAEATDGLAAGAPQLIEPARAGGGAPQPTQDAENAISTGSIGEGGLIGGGTASEASSSEAATSALDDIFGETQFRDYDAPPDPADGGAAVTTVLGTSGVPGSSGAWPGSDSLSDAAVQDGSEALTVAVARIRSRPAGMSRLQVVLLWVGGSLVAVLALVALFLIGTRVPDLLGPAPAVLTTPSPTPTPTPTPTEKPVGPVAAGEHAWDELLGGECLEPYTGPWAENFTVVDCGSDHAAQLVVRGTFDGGDDPQALYPGPDTLQAQINLLCTAPNVIDYPAAGKYSDVQFAASYAATPQEWAGGQHDYFCFVSRSSGEPITGTLAIPPAPKP